MMISALLLAVTTLRPLSGAQFTADTACLKQYKGEAELRERKWSPLDSVTFKVGGKPVKICYSRPSARGRTMLGGVNPYGWLWRTGANEPTILFTPITLSLAGLQVPPGAYSLYSLPGEKEWSIIVNCSTRHWGNTLNESTTAHEVGRTKVKRKRIAQHIETFTIRPDPAASNAKAIVLEWEHTRVRIPVAPG